METIIIKMRENVRGIQMLSPPGTILRKDREYQAKSNPQGALSGLCDNGQWLGVKPGEFSFIEAPEWILRIHAQYCPEIEVRLSQNGSSPQNGGD